MTTNPPRQPPANKPPPPPPPPPKGGDDRSRCLPVYTSRCFPVFPDSGEDWERAVDEAYMRGRRAALSEVLGAIGREGVAPDVCALRSERLATINALRSLCEEFGDNDWPDNLHLADVIEKHLGRLPR